jgi:SET domain-containing protein
MAKAAPKKKKTKRTDKEQFERFVQAARKHGVNESMEDFEVKFRKIVPPRRAKASSS